MLHLSCLKITSILITLIIIVTTSCGWSFTCTCVGTLPHLHNTVLHRIDGVFEVEQVEFYLHILISVITKKNKNSLKNKKDLRMTCPTRYQGICTIGKLWHSWNTVPLRLSD